MKPGIDVSVREVGLRDGIQNISAFMPTAAKLEWLAAEARAGMSEIEVCSFVPPKVIPQFADATEVAARALAIDGLTVAALIPNRKGAERGIAAGVHKLDFVCRSALRTTAPMCAARARSRSPTSPPWPR